MNKEHIKKLLKETEEIVKVVSEEYRPVAFPIVFQEMSDKDELMGDHEKENKKRERKKELPEKDNNVSTLASKMSISVDKLSEILKIKDKSFDLDADIPGDNNTEQEQKGAVIILAVRKICFNESEVLSLDLAQNLRNLGVTPDRNLVSALKRYKNDKGQKLITSRGRKKRGKKYVATPAGLKEGLKLLKEISQAADA